MKLVDKLYNLFSNNVKIGTVDIDKYNTEKKNAVSKIKTPIVTRSIKRNSGFNFATTYDMKIDLDRIFD